ncbi:MAG: transketolase [Acidimicrobiia bacterium]
MVLTQHPVQAAESGDDYQSVLRLLSRLTGDEKHSFAATSTLDVLWTLYDRVLRVDPDQPDHPHRDRFYLSKGHGPMAFYAVLAAKGFIDPELFDDFGTFDSVLGHHPDRTLIPGVEISSGSLGQGLAIAVGAAKAIEIGPRSGRVFVLMGDGELDEGSVHEAIAVAGRFGLGGLVAIVIDNASAAHGWPGGIELRFANEGWSTVTVDGRDHDAIERALLVSHPGVPLAVVARVEPRDA